MRAVLDLDNDVLVAVLRIAASRDTTAGRVSSELAREALASAETPNVRNGVPLIARRPRSMAKPNLELVRQLLGEG